jgi:hypothetical protein
VIWTCSHSPSPNGFGPILTFRAIFILATRRRPVRAFGFWFVYKEMQSLQKGKTVQQSISNPQVFKYAQTLLVMEW